MIETFEKLQPMTKSLLAIGAAALLAILIHRLVLVLVRRLTRERPDAALRFALEESAAPMRATLALLVAQFLLPAAKLPPATGLLVERGVTLALIAAVAWLLVRCAGILEELLLRRHRRDVRDNLEARRVATQVKVVRQVVVALIVVLAFGSMLMIFDRVRQLGLSILASAGVAGIIVGFAAHRSLATMLAGLQVAITQPIRIDDVVIVEGEWGKIEEITLTYVVVGLWDRRRLVVPIGYFLEEPFQNWTRVSADIVGSVFLYVDYSVPVEAMREELRRALEESPEWDGDVCALEVTDASDRAVELRAIMSAPDAGAAWHLRCRVRERLIAFLRERYPQSLPRLRAELGGDCQREAREEALAGGSEG
jgi:small-conductance mechanosensitive channel